MTTDFSSTFDGTAKALIGYHMNVHAAQRSTSRAALVRQTFR